ncbi:MAG: SusD/RagB family nutrient-binding outer membrane lipoprotein [Bacteroidetes bacterium]|nr:SusD/RagB family nutrient-binding outer membrane lipoprotein [Bacteroidota bacterium]
MKKVLYLLITVFILAFTGCTDKFEEFNTDTKHPAVVPGESLFSNAQKQLSDYTSNTNVNTNIFKLISQYWTETTYIDEANYDLVTRNISSNIFSNMYLRVLTDLKEASTIISETTVIAAEESAKQNKLQIIELLNIYVYSHLVDVFGAVPYKDALNTDNVYPKYDLGSDIYKDLFARLDKALSKMNAGSGSFGSSDLYYGGDVASWIKFGNTLKVRMAITIADADNAFAKSAVEAAASKVFSSNADDCLFKYLTSSPNYNQLYGDLIASGRHDFVPANTIVDMMNAKKDPRVSAYFTELNGAYLGGEYGYSNSFSQYSHISDQIQTPDFPGIMLTYSEVCFYLAEAVERGYNVGGTAQSWYNKGITASFDFWGVSGASDYLSQPEVAYTTATGTWKQKIGEQSWLASYTRGIEGYTNWRRLDYPKLYLPENATKYSDIPVRFTFPVNEQTLNAVNYKAASAAIGGDLISTKIFWDKY